MKFDPASNAMTPWQQRFVRSEDAIVDATEEGASLTEAAAAGGISLKALWDRRRTDPVFNSRLLDAIDVGHLKRREAAQSRRMKRVKRLCKAVEQKHAAVEKAIETDPECLDAALRVQLGEDPEGFLSKMIRDEVEVDKIDGRGSGLDDKATVNTQVNVGVAFGGTQADNAPSVDLDGFLRVDLGMSGERDYRRDEPGGVYRRVFWIARHAFRDDVRRVVICTGKGGGKSEVLSLTLARELQKLLVSRVASRPRRGVLNLSAAGGEQAEFAVFTKLRHWLAGPWFARVGAPSREAVDHIEWTLPGGGIACAHSGNSRSEGVEGIDWEAAGADEVCRLPERDNTRVLSAAGLVGPVEDTMVSRSGSTYKLLVASWPEHQGDYLLSRDEREPGQIEMARRTGIREDLTRSFLGEPLTWAGGEAETKRQVMLNEPPFCDFASEVFISTDGTLVVHCPMWQVNPTADLVALRTHHARDPLTFSARFGAWPQAEGRNPFLVDPSVVTQKANHTRVHPMDDDGHFLDWFNGSPEFLYYAHIDASVKRDRAGIAVAHYDQGRVVFDLLLEVVPPGDGAELQLESLRQVLYAMDARGFMFAKVTCDGFEGYSMRQELEAHGIDAEYVSVDRTREAYETWRDALREGKMDWYPSEALQRNADSLIDTGKKVDHTPNGCFSGDTRARLLDGTTPTLAELAAFPDDLHYVYTMRDGKVSVGAARSPRITERDASTVVVTLDSGEQVTCTPDHRFMLRDGTYREAALLAPGDSLMPLYLDVSDNRIKRYDKMKGYEMYLCPGDERWHLTHRMVGKWKYGSEYMGNGRNGKVLHHVVEKRNNDPRQLELLDGKEHLRVHRHEMLARWDDAEFRAKFDAARLARVKSPEFRERQRERMRLRNADPEYRAKVKAGQAIYFANGGREESRARLTAMHSDPNSAMRRAHSIKSGESKVKKKIEKAAGITRWKGIPTAKLTPEQAYQKRVDVARRLHADPEYVAKLRAGHLRYRTSEEGRRKSSETLKATMARPEILAAATERARVMGTRTGKANITRYNKSEKHRRVASEIGKSTIKIAIEARKRHDITFERILEVAKVEWTQVRAAVVLGCERGTIMKRCRRAGIKSWHEVRAIANSTNHKVVSVTPGPRCDVYDLSVDETQNFALAAGVFVHNSKDVSDSMASVCMTVLRDHGGSATIGDVM